MSYEKRKKRITEYLKEHKKLQWILIIILLIIALSLLFFNDYKKKVPSETNQISSYTRDLENRLTTALSQVKGAGRINVVITIESGMETVIAMKKETSTTNNGTETTETPVLVNGKVVVLKEVFPKIQGVMIVAEGADNISVLTKIQQATMSLLDININQIQILTKK